MAYRYGLLDPLDWAEDCREQLFLMNRLWNKLVEIDRKHREEYRKIVGADDAVASLQGKLDELLAEQKRLRDERKALRQHARALVDTRQLDDQLKQLSREVQPLAAACKLARKEASERSRPLLEALNTQQEAWVATARQQANWGIESDRFHPFNVERVRINARSKSDELGDEEKKQINAREEEITREIERIRAECPVTNPPLWWGNANAVIKSYRAARLRAMREGGELKFRRFNGQGRFTVQIIGGATVDDIMRGRKQAKIENGTLAITVYTRDRESRWLTFPIKYHRPLPDDASARVQEVVVTRRKVGTHWRYAAAIVMRLPDAPEVTSGLPACGINLGFRVLADGSLRIATIVDEHGEVAPSDPRRKLSKEYPDVPLNVLPARWMHEMDCVEALRQRRDQMLNDVTATLRECWPQQDRSVITEELAEQIDNILRAPKFGMAKLASITLRWRDHIESTRGGRFDQLDEIPVELRLLYQLETWRKRDKHKLEREANKREGLCLDRRMRYQHLAREIARRYGVIRIGKIDLKNIARVEFANGAENELHQRARRNRGRAALYSLQQELVQQAPKFGSRIEYVGGAFSSTCNACGQRCAVGEDLIHSCENCPAVWDQDVNASRNIRERSCDETKPGERSIEADQGLTEESASDGPDQRGVEG